MGATRGHGPLRAVVVTLALLGSQRPAVAQPVPIQTTRTYAPFIELNVDAGMAMGFRDSRLHWLGAAATGIGLFNGSHVWELTVGLRDMLKERNELTVALARMGIENGLGFHAEGLWSLSGTAAGAGAGLSFSILNVEGAMLFDSTQTKHLLLFLRVPIGLMVHAMGESAH